MQNINSKVLTIIVSLIQMTLAVVFSQYQTKSIKDNATQIKFTQLGFALFVFIISLGQTAFIVNKTKSNKKG